MARKQEGACVECGNQSAIAGVRCDDCVKRHAERWQHYYSVNEAQIRAARRERYTQTNEGERRKSLPDYALRKLWHGMRTRLRRDPHYSGLAFHAPWEDFQTFKDDILATIGPRPDACSIDRVDNTLGYVPGNLRWSDRKTQARNRRTSVHLRQPGYQPVVTPMRRATGKGGPPPDLITVGVETLTKDGWAEKLGLTRNALNMRVRKAGGDWERAICDALANPGSRDKRKWAELAPSGAVFHDLTLVEHRVEQRYGRNWRVAEFRCVCGTVFQADYFAVTKGHTKSCGCRKLAT
jgi:hypothetical protein